MTDQRYGKFAKRIRKFMPRERVLTGQLLRLAWGTDAGFYRMVPQIVVITHNESEVSRLLAEATALRLPVTFRAAGTSLSGQAISDSILIVAGKGWEDYKIGPQALTITMQPGIIGQRVNELLEPYRRIFTPDPASKASSMVGGIVINNASGMNCGTHANSDKMMRSMRLVLADGTIIDTAHPGDSPREKDLLKQLADIRDEIRSDKALTDRIRRKYSIKNVTGLNLLPFVTHDDPRDILAHVMVGSEGTLAFMSEATMATGPLLPYSASSMVYFSSIKEASRAVVALKKEVPEVYSCEMLDKKSLASVNDPTGTDLTSLLIETRAIDEKSLEENVIKIINVILRFGFYGHLMFITDPQESAKLWRMRSGIFPAVGGTRPPGTTSLIEDIAFHIDDLPQATADLAQLIEDCGYTDSCIYGHAFEGNYHFVIAQAFNTQADIDKYRNLIERIVNLVVDKYDGSLKAEHGTGRNMAPFVEKEWGEKAYALMRRIKQAFDPDGILNPGVIFNDDPECFLKHLKPLPLTSEIVDKCIECGFCEVNCMSCGLTLSARQRIATQREISQLEKTGDNPSMLNDLKSQYKYLGEETCAADGLCSLSCPMGINTGELTHILRERQMAKSTLATKGGEWSANHLPVIESGLRAALTLADGAHRLLGDNATTAIGKALHAMGMPLWTPTLPTSYNASKAKDLPQEQHERKVVYFPSCINQTMGPARDKDGKVLPPLVETIVELCQKAGYQVIFPKDMSQLCCGMIWESKGMPEVANKKTAQLEAALLQASEGGRWPVLCDQSPCLHRMRAHIHSMHLYEPAEFIADFLAPHLEFEAISQPIAVHVTCSTRRMGLAQKIISLAMRCSTQVIVPAEVGCCGFAGDKGFTHPELNAWGLRKLRPQIEKSKAKAGYSNSRTCEIGLTTNSGIPYQSIAYLVNSCTHGKS